MMPHTRLAAAVLCALAALVGDARSVSDTNTKSIRVSQGQPDSGGGTIPLVTIDTGSLSGTYSSTSQADGRGNNKSSNSSDQITTTTVSRFLGIRYGQPPVRFTPPQPAQPWTSLYDASAPGPSCLQHFNYPASARNRSKQWFNTPPFPGHESEDCLFLNVFAPGAAPWPSPSKAVMVWLHGGSFQFGSGTLPAYDGNDFAARQNIVVVTLNYRVGVFGFPGAPQLVTQERNLGLLDQRLALDWVQRNIAAFGGDPRRVTIFGESAGAGGVDMLVTSPPATDALPFAAAIMQSGQGTTVLGDLVRNSRHSWRTLARALNCSQDDGLNGDDGDNISLACMRTVPAPTLRDTAEKQSLSFGPTHDGGATWADHSRRDRLASRPGASRIARVPILIGSNLHEGRTMVYGQLDTKALLDGVLPPDTPLGFVNTLLTASPDGSPGPLDLNGQIARIATEVGFQCGAAVVADDSRAVGIPAWRYVYNASFPNTEIFPGSGAYHSAEIKTLFGTYPREGATPFQQELHIAMQTAWADFAKNPVNGPGWASAPDALAILGSGASPGQSDDGREVISVVSPRHVDQRCPLYKALYDLLI
ncbi:hypothetical protein E4U14_004173 [Claviceps sp. LM454 group G7]|nr:hypothetical protein E4U14_004173 [Claviceps sp. LM454 group G7]